MSDFLYDWLPWLGWIVWFIAFETKAVLDDRPGGTLSEAIWRILGLKDQPSGWVQARRIGGIAFVAVLIVHLFIPSFLPL